jgi:hypothetical protein
MDSAVRFAKFYMMTFLWCYEILNYDPQNAKKEGILNFF